MQVLDLPEYWRSLPRESEARSKHAPPEAYMAQWLLPVGAGVLAAVLLGSGVVAAGIALLVCAAGLGTWMLRQTSAAEEAKAVWERSLICLRCPVTFPREDAVAV
ncbi:hypothetical protein [Streptomyces inhibens]|uniref:hypothetical protein n=1 Tax=Streptomyces inhibens TaxID=2293571 RepID=UPI00247AAC19|nr:hypothetical protein [Streptomyces inhibens]